MSHRCPARGCEIVVSDAHLMCRDDWYRVPRPLRIAVLRAYTDSGVGSDPLRRAQAAAIRAVNREWGGHDERRAGEGTA
jgi:hypothetical protein